MVAGLDADVYFEVAGVTTTLILLGRFLEARARRRSGAAIRALLELSAKELPKKSWAKISQIRTLAIERIGKRIGRASPEELAQVVEGLNEIVGA